MPVVSSSSLLRPLVNGNLGANTSLSLATNRSSDAIIQVVCAWPVSGQYGAGSRVLYYVLVAACLLARKATWLRGPCLVAALLFPAVAAIHGIVLAAVHVDGAVDMDLYGAFQLCSIGVLTAPTTVRLSSTYFNDPGRNTIFLWTGLVLAGLVSLTVEFYRSNTFPCSVDDLGTAFSSEVAANLDRFPYGTATCGLTCSSPGGPSSPLRQDAANNIYVVPAPTRLPFGTGTLLAAACGIPAILSLAFMFNKILEINWKSRFGNVNQDELVNEPIQGTNGATPGTMKNVNKMVRDLLSAIEVPVSGAAVLAILVIGETNFFSGQVRYQTEPMASIGQWAPVVGTLLAALGSLYLLLAAEENENECNCPHNYHYQHGRADRHSASRCDQDIRSSQDNTIAHRPSMQEVDIGMLGHPHFFTSSGAPEMGTHPSHELARPVTRHTVFDIDHNNSRRRVAKALTQFTNWLGVAAHVDDSEFKRGRATDYPEIPGERHRNPELSRIRDTYNPARDADGNATPVPWEGRSRANSYMTAGSTTPRATSPSPSARLRSVTLPDQPTTSGLLRTPSSPSWSILPLVDARHGNILEVPPPSHHSPSWSNAHSHPLTTTSIVSVPSGPSSPAIVVSSDTDAISRSDGNQLPSTDLARIPSSAGAPASPSAGDPPRSP
ncbi:hypothetical protein B0T26DRAFT_143893 [Lasiosphaeria miniovina]|uniref:Uncharacterized protein n=1 Tax=Lasiosphaeria miniovina TaxID=1954250 RepID=A0AA40E4G0_9PEZI|nr:uncharacterized protein B0T26DRAFT_143893 [Lasiosphaeria miniovina]KAK0727744.1 hypothetical protein B0T26DRAFT_143893 [Lasiosphaeria miniovina]